MERYDLNVIKPLVKRYVVILVLFALCLWALWLRQQTFAVIALLLCVGATYVARTKRLISLGERLARSAKTAKFGELEVQLEKNLSRLSDQVAAKSAWVHLALTDLDSSVLTLLLSICKVELHEVTKALKPSLRSLRDHGLISHNESTMEASTTVSATELGKQLAQILLATKHPSGDDTSLPTDARRVESQ